MWLTIEAAILTAVAPGDWATFKLAIASDPASRGEHSPVARLLSIERRMVVGQNEHSGQRNAAAFAVNRRNHYEHLNQVEASRLEALRVFV
jgi:hypothetical protein